MTDTKQFTEENDVLKQFMELLNQQNMGDGGFRDSIKPETRWEFS